MVVARGVGGHHGVEAAHAGPPQQTRHARLRRPAVEEHRRAVGVLDQRRVALADVEEADGETVRRAGPLERRRGAAGHEQAQRQRGRGAPRARTGAASARRPRRGAPAGGGRPADGPGGQRRSPRRRPSTWTGDRRRQAQLPRRQVGEALGQPAQVAQREPRASGAERRGRAGAGPRCPSAALTIPSHMAGATAGSASRFAGRPASGTEPKWWASSGAVARVAATLMATPSASARTAMPARPACAVRERCGRSSVQRARQDRAQRHAQNEDAHHRGERQLPARIAGAARVPRQRGHGGEQQRVPARRGPRGAHGRQPGQAHHARALERRARRPPAARRSRSARRAASSRPRGATPASSSSGRASADEQHHVLARRRPADERARSRGSPRA